MVSGKELRRLFDVLGEHPTIEQQEYMVEWVINNLEPALWKFTVSTHFTTYWDYYTNAMMERIAEHGL